MGDSDGGKILVLPKKVRKILFLLVRNGYFASAFETSPRDSHSLPGRIFASSKRGNNVQHHSRCWTLFYIISALGGADFFYSIVWKVRDALTRAKAVTQFIGMSFGAKDGLKLARRILSGSSDF